MFLQKIFSKNQFLQIFYFDIFEKMYIRFSVGIKNENNKMLHNTCNKSINYREKKNID